MGAQRRRSTSRFRGRHDAFDKTSAQARFLQQISETYAVVNLSVFERFEDNAVVTPELLLDMGLVNNKSNAGLKVLGGGQLSKPLTVHAHKFSVSAKEAIEKAGGKAEVIE